jgi:hypothetical protein
VVFVPLSSPVGPLLTATAAIEIPHVYHMAMKEQD